MIPVTIILETNKVALRPVSENDIDAFAVLAKDAEMWEYFTLNLNDPAHLNKWMEMLRADRDAGTRRPFTIIEKATGRIAGSMSLMNISYHDLRTEIGASWLGRDFRSTGINKHAKCALMKYVFEELGFERVEYKTDVLNARARKGLQGIGGIEEGIFRSHMTMWNNRRRDSVFYSVLKSEWPALLQTIFKDIR